MKLLLAVLTCKQRNYPQPGSLHVNGPNENISWVRSAWWSAVRGIDARFFYGRTEEPLLEDEVSLPCGDGFLDAYDKLKGICGWAIEHGYDYVFKTDDDIFIRPDRLLAAFHPSDYRGFPVEADHGQWASGMGYWLSRKAMEVIAASEPSADFEDRAAGLVLAKAGFALTPTPPGTLIACLCDRCRQGIETAAAINLETKAARMSFPAV